MKIKPVGHSTESLKRQAKKLRKASCVTHTEALNSVAKDHGYQSWGHFINIRPATPRPKVKLRRPNVPELAILNYHNTITGAIIGQHPNRKMSVRRHVNVGEVLKELLIMVEYHKRAKKTIQDIRIIMDTWLGCEYDETQLGNAEFNNIYYGNNFNLNGGIPSLKRQAQLRTLLRRAKSILDRSYHDCKPLNDLYKKFDAAMKTLEKWPKTIKIPGLAKGKIRTGTFVRMDHNKKIGLVFTHNTQRHVVEGYTDAGYFLAGRHEVSVIREQPDIAKFEPMRLCLPYGKWKCTDGREILFNRDYCPIWERSSTGEVNKIQPDVHIDYDSSEYYYDDRTAPYYDNKKTIEHCLLVLKDWGVNEKRPQILELLPEALATGNVENLSPKGFS